MMAAVSVNPALQPVTLPAPIDRPIFHDASGRRARLVSLAGGLVATACAAWIAILLAGSLGTATLPALDAPAPAALLSSSSDRPHPPVRPVRATRHLEASSGLPGAHYADLN